MEYPEEIYVSRATASGRYHGIPNALSERCYRLGYEAGKAEQSDYIQSMSSLESVLTDVEQLEGEDLPFVKRLIERTVRAVRAEQAAPLEGYSNLTAAIKAGEPIDWEELHGRNVKCVNPELRGEIHGTLKQNGSLEPYLPGAWWDEFSNAAYINALYDGWYGNDGWTLWLEGETPLRRKTADQLDVGTYFLGNCKLVAEGVMYVGREEESVEKAIRFVPSMTVSQFGAEDWEVIEELGTFQKPEGK